MVGPPSLWRHKAGLPTIQCRGTLGPMAEDPKRADRNQLLDVAALPDGRASATFISPGGAVVISEARLPRDADENDEDSGEGYTVKLR